MQASDFNVVTTNRQSKPQKQGTIKIQIADDMGEMLNYELPNAIYDPDSPFNILGIPFFAAHFGVDPDTPDEDTYITSSATKSLFV